MKIMFCRGCGKETCNEGDICFPCAYPPKPRCVHGLTGDCGQCKMQSLKNLAGITMAEELKYELLKNRMRKLEEKISEKYAHPDIVTRIERLEKQISALTEMYKETSINNAKLIDMELNKKPYKCPVCDGCGKDMNRLVMDGVKEPSTINMKNPACISCEGKGIVWG